MSESLANKLTETFEKNGYLVEKIKCDFEAQFLCKTNFYDLLIYETYKKSKRWWVN